MTYAFPKGSGATGEILKICLISSQTWVNNMLVKLV